MVTYLIVGFFLTQQEQKIRLQSGLYYTAWRTWDACMDHTGVPVPLIWLESLLFLLLFSVVISLFLHLLRCLSVLFEDIITAAATPCRCYWVYPLVRVTTSLSSVRAFLFFACSHQH